MGNPSLSARRAWIEINMSLDAYTHKMVALRKESVDRNEWIKAKYPGCRLSLSARRAWIEIRRFRASWSAVDSRSPQGERG